MPRVLLDTQILLWYQTDSPQLSKSALATLLDADYELMISAAIWWEMAIKISSGKLSVDLPASMTAATQRGIETLSLRTPHFLQVATLPYPSIEHRDSFDRLIIAQTLVEDIVVLTADEKFDLYQGLRRLS